MREPHRCCFGDAGTPQGFVLRLAARMRVHRGRSGALRLLSGGHLIFSTHRLRITDNHATRTRAPNHQRDRDNETEGQNSFESRGHWRDSTPWRLILSSGWVMNCAGSVTEVTCSVARASWFDLDRRAKSKFPDLGRLVLLAVLRVFNCNGLAGTSVLRHQIQSVFEDLLL